MQQDRYSPKNLPEIDHPKCATCGAPMWLVRVGLGPSVDREKRTFACPVCDLPGSTEQPNMN